MTCPTCHGTGRITETTRRLYEQPHTVTGYCDCDDGWALKEAEILADDASRASERAARDWADTHMTRRVWDDMTHDWIAPEDMPRRETRMAAE